MRLSILSFRILSLGRKLLCITLFALAISLSVSAQPPHTQDSLMALRLNNEALSRMNEGKFDASEQLLNKAVQLIPNGFSYYLLCHMYNTKEVWDKSIAYGEKAVQLAPDYLPSYTELFNSYYGAEKWKEAGEIAEKAEKGNNTGSSLDEQMKIVNAGIISASITNFMVFLLCAAIGFLIFYPLYKSAKEKRTIPGDTLRFSEILLLCTAVSCLLWLAFFSMAGWIRSFNPAIDPSQFVNYIRGNIFERDGYESFALYSLMFLNIGMVLLLVPFLKKVKRSQSLYVPVFAGLFVVACFYFFSIKFLPPLAAIEPANIVLPILLSGAATGLYFLYGKSKLWTNVTVILLSVLAGMVSFAPTSLTDLGYVISPALRLFHGAKVSDIYFQYDVFLSYLAVALMKLNIPLDKLPYLGQISFTLLFIGAYFFADRMFKTRGLAVLFVIALIIVRYYSIWADIPTIFQVTPLRLDLWILLLLVAQAKNVHHWLVGGVLGLLVLFHRNLGLIYLGSYAELLIALFVVDVIDQARQHNLNAGTFKDVLLKHVRINAASLLVIACSIALCFVMFKELFSTSALAYRKLGIGMMPITKVSFYWYVTVMVGTLSAFIYYFKDKLGEKYMSLSLFVILLLIGNSMYFFGRSHENNILNISAVLVLSLFILFDILIFLSPVAVVAKQEEKAPAKEKTKPVNTQAQPALAQSNFMPGRNMYLALPVLFIFLSSFYYTGRVGAKIQIQEGNLANGQFTYPLMENFTVDTAAVRKVTNGSDKVYFVDFWGDSYSCYYGGYTPEGYYSPCAAWIYSKDWTAYLQTLLDKGYYIVYPSYMVNRYMEYFKDLRYNQSAQRNFTVALYKQQVPLLIPQTTAEVFHLGIKDTLAANGLDLASVKLNPEFTIEVLLKPNGQQPPTATVLTTLSNLNGFKGFTLKMNKPEQDNYVFGFSNGTNSLPNAVFHLDNGKWHYLAIKVNKEFLKVYDNGSLISSIPSGGLPFVNSEAPVTIGNQPARDGKFNGLIREIKLSNGNLDDNDIIKNSLQIAAQLNSPNTNLVSK